MTLILNGTDNSATVPAVQGGTAGTSTGLYYPTTSAVGISTAGTNAVYIDASQNVGIGGLAAGYTSRLAVVGTGTSTAFRGNINLAVASNGSGYDSTLRFTDSVANSADISMKGGVLATSVNGVFAT